MDTRKRIIFRTGIIGIIGNVLLAGFKILVGSIANSISVLLDGVNNLADAGSGIITIAGTALAAKPADKKHPFGYGRFEYMSSLVIGGLITYAGITSIIESVKGIINPEVSEYSTLTLVVIAVAMFVKLGLALFTQVQGKKAKSDSLIASGKEAILDVGISAATLVAAIIFVITGLSLEAYLATVISVLIIKAGVELLLETVSKIIGEPGEISLAIDIKKAISSMDKVNGAYDLVINDYGPGAYVASVHVEVDDTLSVKEMDVLSRNISEKVFREFGVVITAVGFYSHNTKDEEAMTLEKQVRDIALSQPFVKGLHGFFVDKEAKKMRFDMVISFDAKVRLEVFTDTLAKIKAEYPDYDIMSTMDTDFNELVKGE